MGDRHLAPVSRPSAAAAAVLAAALLGGCASVPAAGRVSTARAGTPSDSAGAPVPSVAPSHTGLLSSRPATLPAARAEVSHRPVAIAVPGYPGFSPVEARTTDPVSRGLDLPTDARTVAWWSSGSMPGDDAGSTVLAAHVSYNGSHGPFTHLDRLRTGDLVSVRRADGSTLRYLVIGVRRVVKSALDRQHLFDGDGVPRLVLITCGGRFDPATRNYSDNIIVSAAPAG